MKTILAYAFVEDKNHRSMKLCNRFDFNKAQEIQTLLFHRFNPASHSQIRQLTDEELQEMIDRADSNGDGAVSMDDFYNIMT